MLFRLCSSHEIIIHIRLDYIGNGYNNQGGVAHKSTIKSGVALMYQPSKRKLVSPIWCRKVGENTFLFR